MDHLATSPGRLTSKPRVKIVEQPAQQAPKFRYAVEGRVSAIPGANSTKDNKTYPTIEITNYVGAATVIVSCVSVDAPHRPHPHKLMKINQKCKYCRNTGLCQNCPISSEHCTDGLCTNCKDGLCVHCKNGICVIDIEVTSKNRLFSFQKIGIQCIKKQEIKNSLIVRQKQGVDPYKTRFGHMSSPRSINLHEVRLCYQLVVPYKKLSIPVVSEVIYNAKKKPVLKIVHLCPTSGSAKGRTIVVLLCEQMKSNDVEVVVYTEVAGRPEWHQPGRINVVHKNCAIVFATPPYKDPDTKHGAKAFIRLRSKSSNEVSNSVRFEYVPDNQDCLEEKKKKDLSPEIEKCYDIFLSPAEHYLNTLNSDRGVPDASYVQSVPQIPSTHDIHTPSVPVTSPDNQDMSIEMLDPTILFPPRTPLQEDQVFFQQEDIAISSLAQGLQDDDGLKDPSEYNFFNVVQSMGQTWNPSMPSTSRDANYMQPAPQVPSPYDMHRPSRNMTSVPVTSPDNREISIEIPSLPLHQVTPPQDQVLPQHDAMNKREYPISSSSVQERIETFAFEYNVDNDMLPIIKPVETNNLTPFRNLLMRPHATVDSDEQDCQVDSCASSEDNENYIERLSDDLEKYLTMIGSNSSE